MRIKIKSAEYKEARSTRNLPDDNYYSTTAFVAESN